MGLPDSRGIPRVPRYSGGGHPPKRPFAYGAFTPCGRPFQAVRLKRFESDGTLQSSTTAPTTPCAQRLQAITRTEFRLLRFRSPLLTECNTCLFSSGYLDVSVPPVPFNALCVQAWMPRHSPRRVSPFGNPRFKRLLAARRGLSQLATSFIGSQRQGIHRVPLVA